jgi:hypothetical protein
MKFVEQHGPVLVFEMRDWERRLLVMVLGLYPQVPPDNFEITKGGLPEDKAGEEALHREMFVEHQGDNRNLVLEFLREAFGEDQAATPLKLRRLEIERERVDWLLQVINDVRVGSWVKLGRPDEAALRKLARKPEAAASLQIMEFCGYVQMVLLDAVMK